MRLTANEFLSWIADNVIQKLFTKVDQMIQAVTDLQAQVAALVAQANTNIGTEQQLKSKLDAALAALAAANAQVASVQSQLDSANHTIAANADAVSKAAAAQAALDAANAQLASVQAELATAKANAVDPNDITAISHEVATLHSTTQALADSATANAPAN